MSRASCYGSRAQRRLRLRCLVLYSEKVNTQFKSVLGRSRHVRWGLGEAFSEGSRTFVALVDSWNVCEWLRGGASLREASAEVLECSSAEVRALIL